MAVLPGAALSRDCCLPNSPREQHPRSKCTELLSSDCLFMLSQDCDNLCFGVHSEVDSLLPLRPLCLRPYSSIFCPSAPFPSHLPSGISRPILHGSVSCVPAVVTVVCVHPFITSTHLPPSAIPPPFPPDVCHQGAVLHCNWQELGGTPLALAVALYALSGLHGMDRPRIGAAG